MGTTPKRMSFKWLSVFVTYCSNFFLHLFSFRDWLVWYAYISIHPAKVSWLSAAPLLISARPVLLRRLKSVVVVLQLLLLSIVSRVSHLYYSGTPPSFMMNIQHSLYILYKRYPTTSIEVIPSVICLLLEKKMKIKRRF